MRKTRCAAALMAGVLAVTGFVGCSSEKNGSAGGATPSSASPTPTVASETLLDQMNDAIAQASSVHVVDVQRIDQSGTTRTIDALGAVDGSNLYAALTEGDSFAEVSVADGTTWVRGNETYWKVTNKLTDDKYELIKDKWVKVGADSASKLDQSTIPRSLVDLVLKDLDTSAVDRSSFGTTDDGAQTIVLTDGRNTEFVLDPATSLPLSMTDGASDLTFDNWNAVPAQPAPPGDQVVDGSGG